MMSSCYIVIVFMLNMLYNLIIRFIFQTAQFLRMSNALGEHELSVIKLDGKIQLIFPYKVN